MAKTNKNTQPREKFNFEKTKIDFLEGIKDKKRWAYCLIEIAIAVALIAIDLLGKIYIYGHCKESGQDIILIKGFLSFTAVENTGAGFGMLSGKTELLSIISLISAIVIIFMVFLTYKRRNPWLRSALVMIIGGAIGNIYDRMALGFVRDFVRADFIDFPVWNFADTFLTVGSILLLIYVIFFFSKEEEEKEKAKLKAKEEVKEEKKADLQTTEEEAVLQTEEEEKV